MGNLMEEGVVRDMTPKLIKDLGVRFLPKGDRRRTYGLYECPYCGEEFEVISSRVNSGYTKSCGCLPGEKHGLSNNKFYQTWRGMLERCSNPNKKEYKDYGARGITVCEEWLDIKNFVDWCDLTYPNTEGVSLDRINNDKGYSPENCTWSSRTIQNINQRMKINNTSGYIGIIWNKKNSNWKAVIGINTKKVYIGSFHTIEEAVLARDNYILENNLPHKLSTEYMKEEKINE